jgi:hypothetical protein
MTAYLRLPRATISRQNLDANGAPENEGSDLPRHLDDQA